MTQGRAAWHAVAVGRIDNVGPAQRAQLATPHPGHEQHATVAILSTDYRPSVFSLWLLHQTRPVSRKRSASRTP